MVGLQGGNPALCQGHANTQASTSEEHRGGGRERFSKESQRKLWDIRMLCENVLL